MFHFQCDVMEAELKEHWKTIPRETQDLYGWEYVRTLIQHCRDGRAGSCYSPAPVMDAMVDALANIHPKCRYLVHGSKNWIDVWCVSVFKSLRFSWQTAFESHSAYYT